MKLESDRLHRRGPHRPGIFLGMVASLFVLEAEAGQLVTDTDNNAPVPEFISARSEMPKALLDQKKEGRYWIAFPIIGYDPDTLFTLGGTVNLFEDGPKESPFFRYNAYDRKTSVAAAYSTGGATQVRFSFDAPNLNQSPWHVYAGAQYVRNDYANYFGVGSATLNSLSYPGSPQTFSRFQSYLDSINQVQGGQTYTYYNNYRQEEAFATMSIERDTMGGVLRPFGAFQIGYYNIGDYSGTNVNGGVVQTTHLRSDQNAGRIEGFNGGWDNSMSFGLTYDTRDFSLNPSRGLFAQAVARTSLKVFGSIENYAQFKLEGRGYYSPFPETRLVFSGRLGYLAQTANTPFYVLSQAPGVQSPSNWLGGFDSLPGFQNNRFAGNNVALASMAARWFFAETTLWNQNLAFGTTAFVDAGSVFDTIGATTLRNWKPSGGVGFLLSWNVSTVVNFNVAASGEGTLFYMGLGLPF